MSLFQKSVVQKYLNDLDSRLINDKYAQFQSFFADPVRQENIRNSKEEQFQEGFLRELFVKVFGYTLNPEPDYNLTTELKNVANSKKADGAILKGKDAVGVIELKGTDTTDLDKIETQAFGYKNHHPKCVYVITSNFEKIRFYIQNAVDHIDFDLFNLSQEEFSLMWLCLAKDNLLNGIPQKIKDSSLLQEENITKKLYADYSKFREEIYNNLVENNPDKDKLLLFKKTQKLLDRFLFIFFAEDRLLLPPNSISEIVKQWDTLKDLDAYVPLYSRFKLYFSYMNTGYKGKKYDIFAYNGGLFAPDEILDSISIDDEILHNHTLKLSQYDFETDVDVNILGHIFEHSLGEIENVQAEIKGEKIDTQKTKRKKDGIFYTPKYITKYIVENTIGKLCEEKRSELDIVDEEYAKGRRKRKKDTVKALDNKLTEYRNWLLSLTILDPACGSGAFLNQALDFLITEHRKIDDLRAQLLGGSIVFSDITTDILEKNIYGVDLNEESVEIAKLSLWLRTAQKGRKLNKLNNNIKCGNSLIDDPEVAGEKAFNWQNEFPEIFANGGFDVVIGNPPYVRLQNIDKVSRDYFALNYITADKNYDIYVLFVEKIKSLISFNGFASYIMPNKFITTEYGEKLKSLLYSEMLLEEYIDFSTFQIFDDATTYTGIFTFSLRTKSNFKYYKVKKDASKHLENINFSKISYSNIKDVRWIFLDKILSNLFFRLSSLTKLKDTQSELFVGLQTSADPVFILEIKGHQLYSKFTNKYYDFKNSDLLKPLLKGAEIRRYTTPTPSFKLIFPYKIDENDFELISKQEMIEKHVQIWEYLNECREKLEGRENGKMKTENWYGYVYLKNMTAFDKPKILTQVLCKNSSLTLDLNNQFYFVGGGTAGGYGITITENINPTTLIAILNSKLINWYIKQFASPFQGGYYAYNKSTLGQIPLPDFINSKINFDYIVNALNKLNDSLFYTKNKIVKYIHTQYNLSAIPKKLHNWHELCFADFIKELNKAIKKTKGDKLSKSDEMEWMELFETKKEEANTIKSEIEKTDKEIDQMVYKLYGLTDDEIAIIESS